MKDVAEKLHVTNKVRHETEIKLSEAIEEKKGAGEVLKMNNETLLRKQAEFDELDKRCIEL